MLWQTDGMSIVRYENFSQRFDSDDEPNFWPDEQPQKKNKTKQKNMTPGHQKIRNLVVWKVAFWRNVKRFKVANKPARQRVLSLFWDFETCFVTLFFSKWYSHLITRVSLESGASKIGAGVHNLFSFSFDPYCSLFLLSQFYVFSSL